jgi:hypothetical protein
MDSRDDGRRKGHDLGEMIDIIELGYALRTWGFTIAALIAAFAIG